MQKQQHKTDLSEKPPVKIDSSDQFSKKDERLVWQGFIEGDDQSLIYIYRQYVQVLFRYGQQFSRRYEFVQDCIQELFYDLIDKRGNLSSVRSIKGYLFASLKRKILRDLKKGDKIQLEEEDSGFSFSEIPLPISLNLKEQDFAIVYQQINLLPASQREVIFLYFYENLGYSEIAEIMNVKVTTARILTYRALDNLEEHLRPYLSSFYTLAALFSHFLPAL